MLIFFIAVTLNFPVRISGVLYESQRVETSLDNGIFVESARSTVECTLHCQRLKKTPFYGDEKKCYCLVVFIDGTNIEQGISFEKVNLL